MAYKFNFNGANKEDTLKSVESQSAELLKSKNMDQGSADRLKSFVNGLGDGVITGSVTDNNNGTVVYNVTVRDKPTPQQAVTMKQSRQAATTSSKDGKVDAGMPGAAGNGRPDLAPTTGSVANRSSTSPSPAAAASQAAAADAKGK